MAGSQRKHNTLCWQINMQHCKQAAANLHQQLASVGQMGYIVLIQKPYLFCNRLVGIPRNCGICNIPGDRPRAAIVAAPGLDLWMVPEYSSSDVVTCLLRTGCDQTPELYVVSAYLDITLPGVVPEPLGRLVDHCRREGKQLLIGMDSNSHSTLWGCEDDNTGRGIGRLYSY